MRRDDGANRSTTRVRSPFLSTRSTLYMRSRVPYQHAVRRACVRACAGKFKSDKMRAHRRSVQLTGTRARALPKNFCSAATAEIYGFFGGCVLGNFLGFRTPSGYAVVARDCSVRKTNNFARIPHNSTTRSTTAVYVYNRTITHNRTQRN